MNEAAEAYAHAAPRVQCNNHLCINAETWMGLMDLRKFDDDAVQMWIDKIKAGHVFRNERIAYAEVTEQGTKMHGLWARPRIPVKFGTTAP